MNYNPNHRRFISSIIARFLPKTPHRQLSTEAKKLSKNLKEDGAVVLENFVSKTQVEAMRSYIATKLCSDPHHPEKGKFSSSDLATKASLHAYYAPEDAVGIPYLWELANDPKILSAIEDRFGAKPTISMLGVWWKFYGFDTEANARELYETYSYSSGEFHRDVDDWSQIKLFIYLTDVDESAGPHDFIRSSHKWFLPPKLRAIYLNDPDFPIADNLVTLTGEAGMAWLEDSYVLHRGAMPTKKNRSIVAVTYTFFPQPPTIFPQTFVPKAPLLPCPDRDRFDPYINRVFLKYE
jgi:hypothetical protein